MDEIVISMMPVMIPLSQEETEFDRRINNLIGAYNGAKDFGMKCMWRDKVLELAKKIVNDS